jgi:hypothetical protein
MKRRLLLLVVLAALAALTALPAQAHVHGITPLDICSVDNANSGGNRAIEEDNPITGLIPVGVGEAENGNLPGGGGAADARVQCP